MMAAIPIVYMMAASAAATAAASAAAANRQASAQNQAADAATTAGGVAAAQGYAREDVQRRSSAQRLAEQYASGAGSGIAQGTGSALDVATTSATNAEYDALTTRYGALAQRDTFLQQAAAGHQNAANTRSGGFFNAAAAGVSSFIGGMRPTTMGGQQSTIGDYFGGG
jgi:hypothetical protein